MKPSECYQCRQSSTTRRDFMRVGTLGFLGVTLSDFFRFSSNQAMAAPTTAQVGKAQAVILLWLEGGPSQVDTWDVKGNTRFKPISTNAPGVQICEIFPKLARHMDKLSIIRSMKTQERNHPQATVETMTGHRQNPAMKFPSFGSIVAKELGPQKNMPPFVVAPAPQENGFFAYQDGFRGAFLGPAYDAMVLTDPSRPGFKVPDLSLPKSITPEAVEDGREMLRIVDRYYRQKEEIAEFAKMDTFEDQALKMILSPDVKNAFDLTQEPDKVKDRYGRNRPGQSALLARRLVEAGSRFVTAAGYKANEWDTHSANEKHLREDLAPLLDQTLSTLLEDLDQRGLLKTTVVIVAGEFGRTPVVNPNGGRDHWPDCWSLLIGGGGIQGGQIIGASDKDGAYVADRPVSLGDLYATVYKAMGVDWTKTYPSPIGRPIYIANGFGDTAGAPLAELA